LPACSGHLMGGPNGREVSRRRRIAKISQIECAAGDVGRQTPKSDNPRFALESRTQDLVYWGTHCCCLQHLSSEPFRAMNHRMSSPLIWCALGMFLIAEAGPYPLGHDARGAVQNLVSQMTPDEASQDSRQAEFRDGSRARPTPFHRSKNCEDFSVGLQALRTPAFCDESLANCRAHAPLFSRAWAGLSNPAELSHVRLVI
jgi:hypothetical protein